MSREESLRDAGIGYRRNNNSSKRSRGNGSGAGMAEPARDMISCTLPALSGVKMVGLPRVGAGFYLARHSTQVPALFKWL